jgi:hypothetical protein
MRQWVWTIWLSAAWAAASAHGQVTVAGKVVDENGVAVSGARVEVRASEQAEPATASSDTAGNFDMTLAGEGEYRIRAERQGYFLFRGAARFEPGRNELSITLNHLQEFAESIDVTYSPPAINLQDPTERKELDNVEILTVPYPAPHDLRNALPLMHGVVQDVTGRLHVNGGATDQTNVTLDGFNISDPVTGRFETRINIESVRTLDLESSRFSADRARASAGSLDIRTKMGDDRWRFGGTNFVPGVSMEGGLHINKWTPRVEFSGPLARGRAWFHNGFDTFYDLDTVPELPEGQNRRRSVSGSNITRLQVNLTPGNILTGSFLVNIADSKRSGLTFLDPVETTTSHRQDLYMASLKDQIYFGGGALLEVGFAATRGLLRQVPRGNEIFEISPYGRRGNYFVYLERHTGRQQWMANAFLPGFQRWGEHQIKMGVDFQLSSFEQAVNRHDYRVLRTDYSVARYVTFAGNRFQERRNFEGAHYILDRWTPREGLLVEAGVRADWDQVVREVVWSPRLSLAWAPRGLRDTKIAMGFGLFHDALTLGTITRHQDQASYATFFGPSGLVSRGPVETAFLVNEAQLQVPAYRTFSLGIERKLPWDLYGKAAYTRRRGRRGFAFVNEGDWLEGGYYDLRNTRRDRYDAVELSVRRTFARQYEWSAGYTRSSARTNAAVDYSLENPIFARQGPGPFSWDAPHRLLSWGWAPIPQRLLPERLRFVTRETTVAFLAEYRTGFPFSVVNEEGFLVEPPNSRRFPRYFNINLHFERKFRAMHYLWAWRFGFNNITNNGNPNVVNNVIDAPGFLAFGRGQQRAFSVRLRLLGKR